MSIRRIFIEDCPFPIYIVPVPESGRSDRRMREEAAIDNLVRHIFGEIARRLHTPDGAPFIEGRDEAISISHSRSHAAIAVARPGTSVGIDIEDERPQLAKVCRRILSEDEYLHFAPYGFLEAWTKKEALYKASRRLFDHEPSYADEISIYPRIMAAGREFKSAVARLSDTTKIAIIWL